MQLPNQHLADKKILTAIGMMSGTSMDGIDVALIRSDGTTFIERGDNFSVEYSHKFRKQLEQSIEQAVSMKTRDERPGNLADVENQLTNLHADAVQTFLKQQNLSASDVDLLGFHGQTVLHRPDKALSVQLGDGQALAKATNIPVVYDMRANDLACGGQGAPLAPIYHQALANNLMSHSLPKPFLSQTPVMFVNIGGISNITYISPYIAPHMNDDNSLIAFDTGPGNALIDQWVQSQANIPFDDNGKIAAEGKVIASIAENYLAESFFQQTIPKSLDRKDFKPLENGAASLPDGARTLCFVTAAAIIKSFKHLPKPPKLLVICGGGRKHPIIMNDLSELAEAKGAEVITAEQAGFNGDTVEAEAWAYMAIRSVKNLTLTFPMTTGCKEAASGGVFVEA